MNKIATLKQFFQVLILGLMGLSLLSQATTIRPVGIRELAQKSELIFEGKVLSTKTHRGQNGMINTSVTFKVADIVKGNFRQDTITLSFLGGHYQGKTLSVGEMHLPKHGEVGLYFVESVTKKLVHPLYGWSQGHFLLKQDINGVQRVTAFDDRPVRSIHYGKSNKKTSSKFNHGVAHDVQLSTSSDIRSAMTAEAFKVTLKKLLLEGES